jgi:hypothetical protein
MDRLGFAPLLSAASLPQKRQGGVLVFEYLHQHSGTEASGVRLSPAARIVVQTATVRIALMAFSLLAD